MRAEKDLLVKKKKENCPFFLQVRSVSTHAPHGKKVQEKKSAVAPHGPSESLKKLRGSTCLSYLLLHQFATEETRFNSIFYE